jgi:hypothetical protein
MTYGTLLTSGLYPVKRKVYFAFHYDDVMRVNNVRNAWKIDHPDSLLNRSFYDSSLWERRKAEGDPAVKELIRQGVGYTSVVCVLVGANTWGRRWVRYEIARSVIDGRGLLAVHINSLKHHVARSPTALGRNPLDYMGIARRQNGSLYLCEWSGRAWKWYDDYTRPVTLPAYLSEPVGLCVRQLSEGAGVYDYVAHSGHKGIGGWIDAAAKRVGR